jgi:hypothetical protein
MNTVAKVGLICVAAIAGLWAVSIVISLVSTVLHWAVIAAVIGGVGYVGYSLVAPKRALGGRTRFLP